MKRLVLIFAILLCPLFANAATKGPYLADEVTGQEINSLAVGQMSGLVSNFVRSQASICNGNCIGVVVKICTGTFCGTFEYKLTGWKMSAKAKDLHNQEYMNATAGAAGHVEMGPTFGYSVVTTGHWERWVYISNGQVSGTDEWEYMIDSFSVTAYHDDYRMYEYLAM